ncbi:MAG: Ni-sirohydrochlorin a,c-diamide synthase [Methanolinea sp.]|jgi:cobyrinic acid a,c-diamide synthase|nr:Ni-sirohydrochlorin a,c-diamide synthase [Methanolinea sp.]
MRALMIAGDRSGSGKTSITLAIAALLSRKMTVQTFKVGMDYIDPSYLSGVTGRPCRNLDTYVMDESQVHTIFDHGCTGADLALVEGVRGLYEGAEALDESGSSASVARILDLPVVLVVNARSITRSAAALVRGFQGFDPQIRIAGVILNNVAGEKHIKKASTAIEHYCGIPVIGAIPRMAEMELAMRHLGLMPYREGQENRDFQDRILIVTERIGEHVNLDQLLSVACTVTRAAPSSGLFAPRKDPDLTIGIAFDEAFNFYYADLFDVLHAGGASTVFFSPLRDPLPEADGYIFGGGYPELFLPGLAANVNMKRDLREASAQGVPVYAECGGLMYLTDEIVLNAGWRGQKEEVRHPMCGIFHGKTTMPARRVVAYVEGRSLPGSPMGDHCFRGHEFHYSDVSLHPGTQFVYSLSRGEGISRGADGALLDRTIGSYTHLHPVASLPMFLQFLATCRQARNA